VQPYYEQDGITIYHGDCKDVLPTLPCVDLVLTDPPYGIQYVSNKREVKYDKIYGDHALPIDQIQKSIRKATSATYVFCRWDNLSAMPPPRSVLVWVKNNWSMGDLKHEHGRQWEAICFYPGPKHEFTTRIPDVIHANITDNVYHPTEKPEELFQALMLANVGQTILDPFMGSGTTLVAAKRLGRTAIGIEQEEKYCEVAVKRLQQGALDFSEHV
jgi:site-specific DNA-methyltransferase (adenine-specific)|tara:strand:- start:8 stop:652 length:645 start_codon:yes stop_codon:yes gene_type:complete